MSLKLPMLVTVGSLSLTTAAWPASVTVSDTSSALPGVALEATAMLVDAGLPVRSGVPRFCAASPPCPDLWAGDGTRGGQFATA